MNNLFNLTEINNKEITNYLVLIKNELEKFFKSKIKQPNIFFIDSRKVLDKIYGKKTENWLTAWVGYGCIFILNPKFYIKESNHKNIKHFWQALKHEYCHLYFNQITGISYPKWLNEGLACYLAGQVKEYPAKEKALKIFNYFQKSDRDVYQIGYSWINLLIKKFGERKIIKLIKSLHQNLSEKQFSNIFYKIFHIHYSKEDFNKLLKVSINER